MTTEDIIDLIATAATQAFKAGQEAGYEEGYKDGLEENCDKQEAAEDEAYCDGYVDGVDDARRDPATADYNLGCMSGDEYVDTAPSEMPVGY